MKSRMQLDENVCYRCKCYGEHMDVHHVFNGPYKEKSEEDGFIVYVHRQCHDLIHRNAVIRLKMKQEGQRRYEASIGDRQSFIERYGKSYL